MSAGAGLRRRNTGRGGQNGEKQGVKRRAGKKKVKKRNRGRFIHNPIGRMEMKQTYSRSGL